MASKDPFQLAVDAAMRDLRRDKVTEYVHREYREAEKIHRDQLKKDLKLDVPAGPKEWSPNKARREEDLERAVERDREMYPNDMTLYVTFDDLGALQGWTVDYPDYWQGHGGPVAAVPASESLGYDEIRREIEEALGELDWDEISGKLEDDEDGA